MTVSVRPVSEPDLPAIGKLMTTYKLSMSINRLLWKTWPNEPLQQEQTLGSVRMAFNSDVTQTLKAVDDESGEIVGFLAFGRRAPVVASEDGGGEMEVPDRFNPEVFRAVIEAMGDIGRENEGLDRIDVEAFVVRQDWRRRGVGSQLMSLVFDQARAAGVPVVMRSEPASHAFFVKHGFKETKAVDLDLAGWAEPFSGYGVFTLKGMIWHP